jgi:4-diphosphocytidyl-2-C-methyl-D-erythritol kinase
VKAALAAQPGCLLARMSGSGATCFGLFGDAPAAAVAAQAIRAANPAWWVADAPILG